jgi:cytidyltransferase-like protein
MKYNLAVCGGTFVHFHKGHREFLRFALSKSLKLLIGLTTKVYVREKNKGKGVDSYQTRKNQLEKFLKKEKALEKVSISPINNVYIPKVWEYLPIEAIIISENTVSGAEKINFKRKEQGEYPLKIEVYPLVKGEDNEYISSSKIRRGNIDSEGISYINPRWIQNRLFLTEKIRSQLKKPLGILIRDILANKINKAPFVITVGDVTTKAFNLLFIGQNISVVDFKVSRIKRFENLKELGFSGRERIFRVNNPAGCLTPALFKAISKIFNLEIDNRRIILQVEGEEDLSVLPLILAAPLDSVIFYGQPNEGIVKVVVTKKTKQVVYKLVDQFETRY